MEADAQRAASAPWHKRLARAGWPAGFPVAQFPNPPLIVAIAAAIAGRLVRGSAETYLTAIFHVALAVWAYEEAVRGVNWFRRLLGGGFLVYIVVSLARRAL